MNRTMRIGGVIGAIAVLGAAGYGLYYAGMQQGARHGVTTPGVGAAGAPGVKGDIGTGSTATAPAASVAADSAAGTATAPEKIDPKTGRRVLYWHDPMMPGQKFDKPGKSPFMDMQLVPVFADDAGPAGSVSIDPRLQQNLGIRTADVVRGRLQQPIDAVGAVAYNDRDVAVVQARANGYVERLFVRAPLDPVRKGDPLAELYVPDWVTAQEEFLTVRRMQLGERLVDGARQRMRLAGMSDEQIALVESTGTVQPRTRIYAPITGIVAELSAREGMTVMSGAPLFRLNGLGTVWVNAEVPETLAASIRPGMAVVATTTALSGRTFKGKVGAVLPDVNAVTRTLKARIELANPGAQLVPGMFARIEFASPHGGEKLLVPTEAVIRTGRRTVVMLSLGDGRFAPGDVEIGAEANGQTEIRKGLTAGQKVVTSGQFLIDSEASLKGFDVRMRGADATSSPAVAMPQPSAAAASPAGAPPAPPAPAKGNVHSGAGKVESIAGNEIMLEHGAIASLDWPPMTMGFRLPGGSAPKGIKAGDAVRFEFRKAADGQYEIVTLAPAAKPFMPASAPAGAKAPVTDHGAHK